MLCTGTYTHEHLAAFKSFEGYNFFVSGHVQEVLYQLISCKCGFQFLSAEVIPSQRVNMKPYDVEEEEKNIYFANSKNIITIRS